VIGHQLQQKRHHLKTKEEEGEDKRSSLSIKDCNYTEAWPAAKKPLENTHGMMRLSRANLLFQEQTFYLNACVLFVMPSAAPTVAAADFP
jgi:hypothetical protein